MKGKCTNIDGNCPNFGKTIEVSDDQDFVCPKCGKPLYEVTEEDSGGHPKKIMIAIILAVIIIVAVVVVLFIPKHKTTSDNDASERDVPQNEEYAEPVSTDTSYLYEADTLPVPVKDNDSVRVDSVIIIKETTHVDTVFEVKKLNPTKPTITYSFGYYIGETNKVGIPEGSGRMYYTERTPIATHDLDRHYAEKGDFYDGSWANGDILSGKLFNSEGQIKEVLIVGKRPNPVYLEDIFQKYLKTLQ